jgi:hypothetical protein
MIWIKRRLSGVEYVPYMDRLEKLMMAMPSQYAEFLMFSTKTEKFGVDDYYVGVPTIQLLPVFDGFDDVPEKDLPKEIDVFLLGDQTKEPFTGRFKFKNR